jgi:hypothetical protein
MIVADIGEYGPQCEWGRFNAKNFDLEWDDGAPTELHSRCLTNRHEL